MRDRRPSRRLALEEVLGVVAGDQPPVERAQRRALDPAAVGHVGAAGREHAALRRVERRGQLALEHDALALARRRCPASRRAAPACRDAAAARRCAPSAPCSTAWPRYITSTSCGDVPDDAEIVRDEEIGEAELAAAGRPAGSAPAPGSRRRAPRPARRRRPASGSSISARAMAMRWRWPPENMCG